MNGRARLQRVIQRTRDHGARTVAQQLATRAVLTVAGPTIHKSTAPGLAELAELAETTHLDADSFLRALLDRPQPDPEAEAAGADYPAVLHAVEQRYTTLQLQFPLYYAVEHETSRLLYLLGRLIPDVTAFETGIANGYSSAIFLQALQTQGAGVLHSVDIREDAGVLVADELRGRWRRNILPVADSQAALTDVMAGAAPLDLFFHDADHSYRAQTFEYELAWIALRPGGILLSDDVDMSRAMIDFARAHGLRYHLLIDRRKAVAAVRKP